MFEDLTGRSVAADQGLGGIDLKDGKGGGNKKKPLAPEIKMERRENRKKAIGELEKEYRIKLEAMGYRVGWSLAER